MLSRHTCNNPLHKREAILSKAVFILLIITAIHLFATAFILFSLFGSLKSSYLEMQSSVLRPHVVRYGKSFSPTKNLNFSPSEIFCDDTDFFSDDITRQFDEIVGEL